MVSVFLYVPNLIGELRLFDRKPGPLAQRALTVLGACRRVHSDTADGVRVPELDRPAPVFPAVLSIVRA